MEGWFGEVETGAGRGEGKRGGCGSKLGLREGADWLYSRGYYKWE